MARKKGQAALEFLMTYGWALVMILIVIAAILYFGVARPKDILPNRCMFSPQIGCVAYSLASSDNTIRLKLMNNVGETITVSSLNLNSETQTNIDCIDPQNPENWPQSSLIDLIFTNCNFQAAGFLPGETEKLSVNISFYPIKWGPSYINSAQGELIAKVS